MPCTLTTTTTPDTTPDTVRPAVPNPGHPETPTNPHTGRSASRDPAERPPLTPPPPDPDRPEAARAARRRAWDPLAAAALLTFPLR
jgi:hypothetical protein